MKRYALAGFLVGVALILGTVISLSFGSDAVRPVTHRVSPASATWQQAPAYEDQQRQLALEGTGRTADLFPTPVVGADAITVPIRTANTLSIESAGRTPADAIDPTGGGVYTVTLGPDPSLVFGAGVASGAYYQVARSLLEIDVPILPLPAMEATLVIPLEAYSTHAAGDWAAPTVAIHRGIWDDGDFTYGNPVLWDAWETEPMAEYATEGIFAVPAEMTDEERSTPHGGWVDIPLGSVSAGPLRLVVRERDDTSAIPADRAWGFGTSDAMLGDGEPFLRLSEGGAP